MRKVLSIVTLVLALTMVHAQSLPEVFIEAHPINGLPGLQAYTYGKHHGKWLIFGGRTDGLHRRQPFASFDVAGNNKNIYLVDPENNQVWSSGISSLSQALQDQLQSTNMQFYQVDSTLYIIGGYGYSVVAADHITYDGLIAVDLSGLSTALMQGGSITSYFRMYNDPFLAVTGGHLGKLNNSFYLAVGNRFDGRYNPMGGATYTQAYTNAIRRFDIVDNGTNLSITNRDSMVDAVQLHRRDYNMVPQVFSGNIPGYTIFSGVFQPNVDLPFLNSVDFNATSYTPNNNFNQYLNHYHCPTFGVYDEAGDRMHSFFFGGISQYYIDSSDTQIQDDNVPFVKTITRITRDAVGNMTETKLNAEMPDYFGASAELILADGLPQFPNDVIKMNQLNSDTTFVGYIYGGISSSGPNIFFINTGSESSASSNAYKVYLIKPAVPSGVMTAHIPVFSLKVFPNPSAKGMISFTCNGNVEPNTLVYLQNAQGQIIRTQLLREIRKAGDIYRIDSIPESGQYILSVSSGQYLKSVNVIIQ